MICAGQINPELHDSCQGILIKKIYKVNLFFYLFFLKIFIGDSGG